MMDTIKPNRHLDLWLGVNGMGWTARYDAATEKNFNASFLDWDKENRRMVWTGYVSNKMKGLYEDMLCNIEQEIWEPTKNLEQAVMMLEHFIDGRSDFAYSELVFSEKDDFGWMAVIFPHKKDAPYWPNGRGYKYGLSFAICTALYAAVTEYEV